MRKYYFFSYVLKGKLHNHVIDVHPLYWQEVANKKERGQCTILTWIEISEEEHKKYRGY